MAYPEATRWLWSSTPVMAGICTSVIKQAVAARREDARKSTADGWHFSGDAVRFLRGGERAAGAWPT
jgi:hypothetical protein